MPLNTQLASVFSRRGIAFEQIRHDSAGTTRPRASSPHTANARSVLLAIDGRLTLAIVRAGRNVDAAKVSQGFGAREVELADDDELQDVCTECTTDESVAPFGNLCGLPVVLDAELCLSTKLTFGETHAGAIRVQLIDFLKLLQPRVMDISTDSRG